MQKDFDILYSKENRIQEAFIETTYHCNIVCRHCYISEDPVSLSLTQLEKIFAELKEMGCVDLRLSGGEIFLRNDLFIILDRAIEMGFRITLMSNGILIRDEIIEKLKDYPIKKIKISLYSLQPEIHELITKASGSHEKTLNAIKKLHQAGIRVIVNTMIQRENASGLSELKEFAEEHGLGFQCDYKLFPRHDGDSVPLDYYVEKDELVQLFKTGIISEFGEVWYYQISFQQARQDVEQIINKYVEHGFCQRIDDKDSDHSQLGEKATVLPLRIEDLTIDYTGPMIKKAGFIITEHCNLRCRHCYVAPQGANRMKFEDWIRVAAELKEMGCNEIMIIGGEPFSVPWLVDLLEFLEEEGFVYYIDTNGTLITDEDIERLSRLRLLWYVDVSIYGLTEESYRKVTGREIHPDLVLTNLKKMQQAGISIRPKFVSMRSNMADLPLISAMGEKYGYKIQNKYIPHHARSDGDQAVLEENIPVEQVIDLVEKGYIYVSTQANPHKHCDMERCSIGSNGKVSMCEKTTGLIYGDVLSKSLQDIWKYREKVWQPTETNQKCLECQLQKYCTRCDGVSYTLTGCTSSDVPYLCEYAKHLADKFG